ncbi:toxin zeta, partial [Lactobacillus salivarius]
AVPRIESYLGTLARYEDQFSLSPRTARATTKEAHDVVVRQLPDNLDFLYKQRLFKEIRLYDRKGNKLYSSLENLNESPKKIITEILNRKLDNNTLLNSIDSVINKMEINHH